MPHFFISSAQIQNNSVEISDKENYNHIARSLRARAGEGLLLIDENMIQYETVISEITGSKFWRRLKNHTRAKDILILNCIWHKVLCARMPRISL